MIFWGNILLNVIYYILQTMKSNAHETAPKNGTTLFYEQLEYTLYLLFPGTDHKIVKNVGANTTQAEKFNHNHIADLNTFLNVCQNTRIHKKL
jgi:hypothetical protein